jgi:rhodanese-related sulfurtransferase
MQRRMNYALQPMSREAFIELMTRDLARAPRYFPMDAELNRRGARSLEDITLRALAPAEVSGLVLDVRDAAEYGAGHIPGSINIGLSGQYASWAGTLVSANDEVTIVAADRTRAEEAVMRLARVGLENVAGYLDGGIDAWRAAGLPLDTIPQIDVSELQSMDVEVLDVRRIGEYEAGHVPHAMNVPLDTLPERIDELDPSKAIAVICASGYRSSTATSILERHEFRTLYNVTGGTSAWVAAGFATRR